MVSHIKTLSFIRVELIEVEVQVRTWTSAFASIGLSIPMKRVTVNLSPADLLKEGSHFDLAIAISLLIEIDSGQKSMLAKRLTSNYAEPK
ncbi:MAG: hypothetical protein MRQ07_04135 [Candidatus Midichloria sp.]|nr:hypothetical protein [Candidatus Midichloria sp.]